MSSETALKEACAKARARIAFLQQQRHGPVATVNERGQVEYWNLEQRGKELNDLGEFVDKNCPPD